MASLAARLQTHVRHVFHASPSVLAVQVLQLSKLMADPELQRLGDSLYQELSFAGGQAAVRRGDQYGSASRVQGPAADQVRLFSC